MTDEKRPGADKQRKPYEKPQLRAIALRPEEAVLGFCKTSGFSGPASGSCAVPLCFTLGT